MSIYFKKIFRYVLFLLLSVFLFIPMWFVHLFLKKPSNDAKWKPQYALLPEIDLDDDNISIKNLRDFRYHPDKSIAQANYKNETFKLSKMQKVWYGISHFGPHGLAHVLLSFEFSDGKYLVLSIEARLKKRHLGYNALKGLFGTYTKFMVFATEQDVIGLRTHVRGEKLYLYPLDISELYTKALLLNYLGRAQSLHTTPSFYNSVTDNCMTSLLIESQDFDNIVSWMDRRVLFPGYSDEIAHELDLIDNNRPLEELRRMALVDPAVTTLEDPDFSKKIRANFIASP
ncbi:MAG: DUF4105 domain-containing protein [Gammaproteobacteria bacterium]|nr:DUF4105 domain-containing protein [Gammaproteobacteria bacterium]